MSGELAVNKIIVLKFTDPLTIHIWYVLQNTETFWPTHFNITPWQNLLHIEGMLIASVYYEIQN